MNDWYKDALHKLDYAKYKIDQLSSEVEISTAINKKFITNEINDILGNIRAPLDYFAKYIGKEVGKKAKNPAFPLATGELDFTNKYVAGINIDNTDLKNHFKSVQSYSGVKWMYELNKMNNNEKHQEINRQEVKVEENVPYMNIGGNHFINNTFSNNDKNVVIISDDKEYEVDISKVPGYKKKFIYIFKYNNREVFECLSDFRVNALKFIEEGKNIIKTIK